MTWTWGKAPTLRALAMRLEIERVERANQIMQIMLGGPTMPTDDNALNYCPHCKTAGGHTEDCPVTEQIREMLQPLPKTQRERERFGIDEIERGPKVIK